MNIMGIEWVDTKQLEHEEVCVLQPDFTWKHFTGPKFPTHEARFEGKPGAIAARIQELRDQLNWGNHVVLHTYRAGPRGDGNCIFLVRLYATSLPHGDGPLNRVDRVVLRAIGRVLVETARDTERVLVELVSTHMAPGIRDGEDERFLQYLENMIKAVRAEERELLSEQVGESDSGRQP